MDGAYAKAIARGAGGPMNLLLVAYFYPPCRDTGAHRPAAMAKWLRRLGHRVTVLTTSAYGPAIRPRTRGSFGRPISSACAPPAWPRQRRRAVRLRHLLGPPPPPEQGPRPRAADRRLGAVRTGRRCAESRATVRLRDHELSARVCPRRRPRAVGAASRGSRTSATLGPSSRSDRPSPRAPAAARRGAGTPVATACGRSRLRQPSRRRRSPGTTRIEPALVPNGWDPDLSAGSASDGRTPAGPRPDLAPLHGPLRQLWPRPGPPVRRAAQAGEEHRTAASLELVSPARSPRPRTG